MSTKKIIAIIVLLIVLIGLVVFSRSRSATPVDETLKTYSSQTLGVSFEYPAHYYLEEKNTGSPQRNRMTLVLYEDTEENREVREGTAPPREGPTAITLDFFQLVENESYTPADWVRGISNSNYKLSPDGVITETSIAGREAVSYRWSGLYEGHSTVFMHDNNVVMASVTYITPEDEIISVFNNLMNSISLE
jgi:hypothetical protein